MMYSLYIQGYSQCERYDYNLSACDPKYPVVGTCIPTATPADEVQQIPCDNGFWYDTSVYISTTVTEARYIMFT